MCIKEQFDEVIRYSQGIQNPQTDRLFEIWQEKKQSFIERFGGLIYEFPEKVTFELGEKEKHERVIRFAGDVSSRWGYVDLAEFIEAQEAGFFKNLTIEDAEGHDGKVIKKGTKLVKAFKHFIKDSDRSLFDIQNEASRIIQEDRIEGTLCLSVHPLDFLSLSENTYNWRSCHSLDGEYRAGNLSYMMDDCTFICYLKGADNVILPDFGPNVKWNSKKWRVLLYESPDSKLMMAGRQYPFESKRGLDYVIEQAFPNFGKWKKVTTKDVLYETVKDAEGSCQYNDLLYSSCYTPWFTTSEMTDSTLTVGAETHCLYCGKETITKGQETMMCDDCTLAYGTEENETVTHCDCCGQRIFVDDSYRTEDGFICESCIDNYYRVCDCCGEYIHIDYIKYKHRTQEYLCPMCLEEEEE